MAHSTRKKQKAARGGLTKNQALKAQRSAMQSERLRNILRWDEERQTKKEQEADKPVKKERRVSMKASARIRRRTALLSLESRLLLATDPAVKTKLERERATLINRL